MRAAVLSASIYLAFRRPNYAAPVPAQPTSAICILFPDNNSGVRGLVSFQQEGPGFPTRIAATVKGLAPNKKHGFHIHQYGDLTEGCASAGPHYNPTAKTHGGPTDDERHVGDLGNITADSEGVGFLALTDEKISLCGEHSVVGRSCVVHAKEDDLGRGAGDSKLTGNSGGRVACGVIGLAAEFKGVAQSRAGK